MPAIWMLFMLIVLGNWAFWLNQEEELTHPNSEKRAELSLRIVVAIGIVSLIICFLIQVALK